jgi:hypothetical protein
VSTGRSSQGRTVFGPKKVDSDGKPGFYAHAALIYRMRRLGETWYCELVPDYCFTSDGMAEHRNADKLIAGIKRLDRHPAVEGPALTTMGDCRAFNYVREEKPLIRLRRCWSSTPSAISTTGSRWTM